MLGNVVLTPEQISAIDFNHNKQVDSEETLSLLKYLLGTLKELPFASASSTVKVDAASSAAAEASAGITEENVRYAPTWAPEGMMFRGEAFEYTDETSGTVSKYAIQYTPLDFIDDEDQRGFRFEQQKEADDSSTQAPDAAQEITINGNPGFYTQTNTNLNGGTVAKYHLVWKQDGYVMQLCNDLPLTLEDLVNVAESVRPRKLVSLTDSTGATAEMYEPQFNFSKTKTGTDSVYQQVTVTPYEDAPTEYDRMFRITEFPERVRLDSTKEYFTYYDAETKDDIEVRSTRYNVQTKDGMKNVHLHVQTQKNFDFLLPYGRDESGCGYDMKMITINGHTAFCYEFYFTNDNGDLEVAYFPCWMQDGYIMLMTDSCRFTLDEVIKIAESVAEVRMD